MLDDDDAVIVPAPPIEYLGHTHPHHPPVRAGGPQPAFYAIEHRRTIIPVLFTIGISMFAFGAARYVVSPDSPLGLQGAWFSFVLFGFGLVCLAACAVSVMQLQQVLAKQAKKR